jgi:hypothetical protein
VDISKKLILLKKAVLERPVLFSLGITSILFVGFFIFFTSTFETNDDAYMMLFASGFYLGRPVEYILPSGVLLGVLLKNLYLLVPQGNWYVWYLLFTHFISVWIILYIAIRRLKNISFLLTLLVSIVYFESYFLVYLQFTTTAFLVSTAALFLFLQQLKNKLSTYPQIIFPILLLVFASQIREKVPLLVLTLGSPALIFLTYSNQKWRLTFFFGIVFLGLFLITQFLENHHVGQIADWGKHRELFDKGFYPVYNKPLIPFNEDSSIYSAVGWSKNDFSLFTAGFFEEMPKYSMENLRVVAKGNDHNKVAPTVIFNQILTILFKFKYLFALTLFSLVALFLHKNKGLSLIAILMTLLWGIICFYLGLDLILKARVVIPMLMVIQLFCVFSYVDNPLFLCLNYRFVNRIVIPIVLFLILGVGIFRIYINDVQNIKPSIQHYEKKYAALVCQFPDKVFVVWGNGFSPDHINVLSNFYSDKKKGQLYLMLANLGYWHNPQLLKLHHEKNVYTALLDNPDFLLLILKDKEAYLPNLYKFYEENYGLKVNGKPIALFKNTETNNTDFSIYKIIHDQPQR